MSYFTDQKQKDFKADFGFMPPHRTKTECKNPVFADHNLHRIALMKDEMGKRNPEIAKLLRMFYSG